MSDIGYCVMLQSRFTDHPHVTLIWFSLSESAEVYDLDHVVYRVTEAMDRIGDTFSRFDLVVKGREEFAENTMVTEMVPTFQLKTARAILDRSIRVGKDEHNPYLPGITPSIHPYRPHVSDWIDPAGVKRVWGDGLNPEPHPFDTLVLSRDREPIYASTLTP